MGVELSRTTSTWPGADSPIPTLLLNTAVPASDISSVRAVIPLPPSLPLKTISLSDASLSILKLLSLLYIEPQCVPPSLRWTVAPASSPSSIIVPSTSNVKSPELSAIVVPSMLMLSISTPASAVILPTTSSVPPKLASLIILLMSFALVMCYTSWFSTDVL